MRSFQTDRSHFRSRNSLSSCGGMELTTKSENKVGARPPAFLPVDTTLGLFRNKLIFCSYGRSERSYLRQLHSDLLAGKVSEQPLERGATAHNLPLEPTAAQRKV